MKIVITDVMRILMKKDQNCTPWQLKIKLSLLN